MSAGFQTFSLNSKGRLLVFDKPVVMGIINITNDSFFEKSRKINIDSILDTASNMLKDGASILDIGGQSTRPGAAEISIDEECERIVEPVKKIKERFPCSIISTDTYRSSVAKAAIDSGADMVNDISAGDFDPEMIPVVASLNVPYIAMHTQGNPQNMQNNPQYNDVVTEVFDYLSNKISVLRQAGIKDVIIDPGFGFGKTIEHNYKLLKTLHGFKILEVPLLAGLSRKSMIYRLLQTSAGEALNGTTALNMLALQQGADILRVHDVRAAMDCIQLWNFYTDA